MSNLPLHLPRWVEWEGLGYPETDNVVYYSYGILDMTRYGNLADLAMTLFRDGLSDTRSEAMALLVGSIVTTGWILSEGDDRLLEVYDPDGEYEDTPRPEPVTWVEISFGN